MQFSVPVKDTRTVCELLAKMLRGHELDGKVSVNARNGIVAVEIRHMGTSSLVFETRSADGSTAFRLKEKKIAYLHRPFMETFEGRFRRVIRDLGGEIREA